MTEDTHTVIMEVYRGVVTVTSPETLNGQYIEKCSLYHICSLITKGRKYFCCCMRTEWWFKVISGTNGHVDFRWVDIADIDQCPNLNDRSWIKVQKCKKRVVMKWLF